MFIVCSDGNHKSKNTCEQVKSFHIWWSDNLNNFKAMKILVQFSVYLNNSDVYNQ